MGLKDLLGGGPAVATVEDVPENITQEAILEVILDEGTTPAVPALDGELDFDDIMASDELDFSEDGIQKQRAVFEIAEASKDRKENGVLAKIAFSAVDTNVIMFNITETFWLAHTNPVAQQIGRGKIRQVYRAVYGEPTGSLEGLTGHYVSCWMKEGSDGRATLSGYQEATEDEVEEARASAGLGGL